MVFLNMCAPSSLEEMKSAQSGVDAFSFVSTRCLSRLLAQESHTPISWSCCFTSASSPSLLTTCKLLSSSANSPPQSHPPQNQKAVSVFAEHIRGQTGGSNEALHQQQGSAISNRSCSEACGQAGLRRVGLSKPKMALTSFFGECSKLRGVAYNAPPPKQV